MSYFLIVGYIITFLKCLLYPFKWLAKQFSTKTTTPELKIMGTGVYLPKKYVDNTELLEMINTEELQKRNKCNKPLKQFITDYYGVSGRYIASDEETHSMMSYLAIKFAILDAKINWTEVDCMIYASPGMDKLIPDTSVFIHERLSKELPEGTNHNPPSFTVHSTCISALQALNIANAFIKSQQYKTIVIVSAEKTSVVTNINDPKTCTILGDMATAIVVRGNVGNNKVTTSKFKTYSTDLCNSLTLEFGSINHSLKGINHSYEDFVFTIRDNKKLIKTVPTIFNDFISELILCDYDHIVIHQPSKIAVDHVKPIFGDKIVESFDTVGNCASCSIPYNLHCLLHSNKIKRGDGILLVGMGAGLGAGFVTLVY